MTTSAFNFSFLDRELLPKNHLLSFELIIYDKIIFENTDKR